MNRSKIIQAYEARHNTARAEQVETEQAEQLANPPKYTFINDDCDAVNAMSIFEAELQDKTRARLADIIDAREVVYECYPEALMIHQDESSFSLEFKDGSILKVDHVRGLLRILRLA